jgi:APA family basic amino acid/polyamine antiporter
VAQVGSLFAADAWFRITYIAGEVKEPKRNIPLALLYGAGLVIVGALSLGLLTGNLPTLPGGPGSSGDGGPSRTATPSNVVIVDPRADVPGTIAYVKAGNIWLQHGNRAEQLTSGGTDAMASFSPDGAWVYFVRSTSEAGRWRINGAARRFRLATPTLMRVHADGSGEPEALLTGRITSGSYTWSTSRQPAPRPTGRCWSPTGPTQ